MLVTTYEIYIVLGQYCLVVTYQLTRTFSGGRKGGRRRASAAGGTVQGAAFRGAKIWNSEIWPLLVKWRLHWQLQLINLGSIAIRNYTPNHSVLFTVHTNAIVVTIRISIGDLIAGVRAATKTFAPGGKHPRAATTYLATIAQRPYKL